MNKVVHVGHSSRFYEEFIVLNDVEGIDASHVYHIFGSVSLKGISKNKNIKIHEKSILQYLIGYISLIYDAINSNKIILHGLFDPRLIFLFCVFFFLPKKSVWFLWGGDLYLYKEKSTINEFFRRILIRRIGFIATYLEGDYKLCKLWYKTNAKFVKCLLYPSNIVSSIQKSNVNNKTEVKDKVKIVVGNSADPQNRHLEILEVLEQFKKSISMVYLPLSYGNEAYAKKIILQYKVVFGEEIVHPITEYLPKDKYYNLVDDIDVAVYGHKRQQAMGNTINFLSKNKVVFMRSDVNQWGYFKNNNIKVFDIKDFGKELKTQPPTNNRCIREIHSKANYVEQLKKIYML